MSITLSALPNLTSLPPGALIAIAVLGVIEIAFDVVALVNLYRRPIDRVTLGNKWVWVAIIVVINLFGAILYFAIGRKPAVSAENAQPAVPRATNAQEIADKLYGPRDPGAK